MRETTSPPQSVEYTYEWYREYLGLLRSAGYSFGSFRDPPSPGTVFLRHDVDLSVERALRMARTEADLGVESTYFFLVTSGLYNPLAREHREGIREIAALGHEVGLHFDTHQYWEAEPPEDDLLARVDEERSVLETVHPEAVSPISFHVPPEWVLDRRFEAFRSTYDPALFADVAYVADSGGRWRDDPPPVGELSETMQVLVHPGLWHDVDTGFDASVRAAATASCRRTDERVREEFLGE